MKEKLINQYNKLKLSPIKIKQSLQSIDKNISIFENEKLIKKLNSITGLGNTKINDLLNQGLKNINQLKEEKWFNQLPKTAQFHIKHKPSKFISHNVMSKLEPYLINFNKAEIILTGSYRRDTKYSNDFDIMIVSDKLNMIVPQVYVFQES